MSVIPPTRFSVGRPRFHSNCTIFRENQRLTVAPPAGYYAVSERFYRVSRRGYPSLQNVYRSIYISIMRGAAVWTCPVSVNKPYLVVSSLTDVTGFCCRLPLACFGKRFAILLANPLKYH